MKQGSGTILAIEQPVLRRDNKTPGGEPGDYMRLWGPTQQAPSGAATGTIGQVLDLLSDAKGPPAQE